MVTRGDLWEEGVVRELKINMCTAKSLQSCPTLCHPIDGSPPGSSFPGILRARTLEWVAIFFSNAWKWKVKVKSLSRVRLLATPWTAAYQTPPSMGFSRQEYWSGVPLPSPGKGGVGINVLVLMMTFLFTSVAAGGESCLRQIINVGYWKMLGEVKTWLVGWLGYCQEVNNRLINVVISHCWHIVFFIRAPAGIKWLN